MPFRCDMCDELHDGLPDVAMTYPDPYLDVPVEARAMLTTYTPDRCTVRQGDGQHYFIRGVIFIPVHDEVEPFGIGVWLSQSKESFERYARDMRDMAPTRGFLVNRLPFYPDTHGLVARAVFPSDGRRPSFELEPTDHPLHVDQRNGILVKRAWAMIHGRS